MAQVELKGLPPASNRYAAVAKIIEPSVVGVQTSVQVASPFGDGGLFEPEIRATTRDRE